MFRSTIQAPYFAPKSALDCSPLPIIPLSNRWEPLWLHIKISSLSIGTRLIVLPTCARDKDSSSQCALCLFCSLYLVPVRNARLSQGATASATEHGKCRMAGSSPLKATHILYLALECKM